MRRQIKSKITNFILQKFFQIKTLIITAIFRVFGVLKITIQASLNSFKFEESGIMTSHLYVIKLEVQCAYLGKFELV